MGGSHGDDEEDTSYALEGLFDDGEIVIVSFEEDGGGFFELEGRWRGGRTDEVVNEFVLAEEEAGCRAALDACSSENEVCL